MLTFHRRNHTTEYGIHLPDLTPNELLPSSSLFVSYAWSQGGNNPIDTLFMNGYSLELRNNTIQTYLSTDKVFQFYNKDYASIMDYFSGTTFNITNIEEQCNDFYIIEGTFSTKLMWNYNYTEGETPVNKTMTNGKFRVIRRFNFDPTGE